MKRRQVQICFHPEERLSRAIAFDQVKNGAVKPNSLRLQVSVSRSSMRESGAEPKFGAAPPKFNGIVEISVASAREVRSASVYAVCVDEPTEDNAEHALLALVTDATSDVEPDVQVARDMMAERWQIVRPPQK